MKKKLRKVLSIAMIYAVAILLVFCLTHRVERLESREDLRNINASMALNLK